MKEIERYFSVLLTELEKGRNVMAVTLVNSIGSAPRRTGARMLIGEKGRFFGTIGGGAVEFRAIKEASEFFERKISLVRQYDLSPTDLDHLGMICGGAVTAAFHYIRADREDVKALCRTALLKLKSPCRLWLALELPDLVENSAEGPAAGSAEGAVKNYRMELHTGECGGTQGVYPAGSGKSVYLELISKDLLVHLFGGGHVARELAPLLTKAGFSYAVYDDRKEYLQKENFPDAVKTTLVSFDHLEGSLVPAADHYFVIMTRGHQCDFQAQAFAMRIQERTSYIGVIGSKKKTARLEKRLTEIGISREALACVHAPIGLPIGAETPAEIAVSIAAQLIQIRNTSLSVANQGSGQQQKNGSTPA